MSEVLLSTLVTQKVEDIKPYWRNPRRIPPEAVDAVAESIERYGYQQPIVVDTNNVVIVGHTRLLAVQKLGWTEVPVYIADLTEEKANEYRLVDNRTSEMTSWDHNALVLELREWESALLESFFPDMDLEVTAITDAVRVTNQDMEEAAITVREVAAENPVTHHSTQVVCPACFHTFEVRTKSLPGLSAEALAVLVKAEEAEEAEAV